MMPTSSLRSELVDTGAVRVGVTVSEEVFIGLLRDVPVERARLVRTGSGRRPDPHSTGDFRRGASWEQHGRPASHCRIHITSQHRCPERASVFEWYKTDQRLTCEGVLGTVK